MRIFTVEPNASVNMSKNKLKIGYLKTIRLIPTLFIVDIWVCDDQDNLARYYSKRYGASPQYHIEQVSNNQVATIKSYRESELKGERRIVMNVDSWNMAYIVHEINHVVYHLAKECGIETNYESQEWISYMLEYLFEQCQNDGSFTTLENYIEK